MLICENIDMGNQASIKKSSSYHAGHLHLSDTLLDSSLEIVVDIFWWENSLMIDFNCVQVLYWDLSFYRNDKCHHRETELQNFTDMADISV